MNKKIIRLTEGDLHRIVKESVNRVIKEMDYKTYLSAARKSKWGDKRDKLGDRQEKFYDKAAEEFNKKFGYEDENGKYWAEPTVPTSFTTFLRTEIPHRRYYHDEQGRTKETEWGLTHPNKNGFDFPPKPILYPRYSWPAYEDNPGHDDDRDQAILHAISGNDDLNKFERGDYKYVKGKGWVDHSGKKN